MNIQRRIKTIMSKSASEREIELRKLAAELGCILSSTYGGAGDKHLEDELIRMIQEVAIIRNNRIKRAWMFVIMVTSYGLATLVVAASVMRSWNTQLEGFIVVFLVLAAADWWMDKVQRTTQLICRANEVSLTTVGEFLNPAFIKYSLPITAAKWGWVAVWAWYDSAMLASSALFASWLITVVSPTPFRLTIPSVLKQIERVRAVDSDFGNQLFQMVETWKANLTIDLSIKHDNYFSSHAL